MAAAPIDRIVMQDVYDWMTTSFYGAAEALTEEQVEEAKALNEVLGESLWPSSVTVPMALLAASTLLLSARMATQQGALKVSTAAVAYFSTVSAAYSQLNGWPLHQSLFYAMDTGFSIGFGTFPDPSDESRAFTLVHLMIGASAMGGALAWFAESAMHYRPMVGVEALQQEYRAGRKDASAAARASQRFLERHGKGLWLLAIFTLWIGSGAYYGVYRQRWTLVRSLLFACSALSTAGLEGPPLTDNGFLRKDDALFVSFFVFTGVPVFAQCLSEVASIFVNRFVLMQEQARVHEAKITADDLALVKKLFGGKQSEVDFAQFLALELLRLGKVEHDSLKLIHEHFLSYDANLDEMLSVEELVRANRAPKSLLAVLSMRERNNSTF